MSLDTLFNDLRTAAPPTPFAPATSVRRRGRQRNHRQALSAGATVLVVAGAGVGVVSQLSRPTLPPPTTGSPSAPVTGSPSQVASPSGDGLLTAADLGPGRWQRGPSEILQGRDRWYWSEACAGYPTPEALRHRAAVATVHYQRSATESVTEILETYQPGWGARGLDAVRDTVARCQTVPPEQGVAPTVRSIVETDFAGDESLLVQVDNYMFEGESIAPAPFRSYVGVVRVGDRVATVFHASRGQDAVRQLGIRAAALLI